MSSPYPSYEQQPNPYGSPYSAPAPVRNTSLPTGCVVYFVIDLLICFLRGAQVLLGLFLLTSATGQVPEESRIPLLFDTLTAAGIAIFGIPGNGLMLARQTWASILAYGAVLFTVLNMGSAMYSSMIMWEAAAQNPQPGFREGMIIGFVISLLIRGAITFGYLLAVFKFDTWAKDLTPTPE